jgi:hypothetical protein
VLTAPPERLDVEDHGWAERPLQTLEIVALHGGRHGADAADLAPGTQPGDQALLHASHRIVERELRRELLAAASAFYLPA